MGKTSREILKGLASAITAFVPTYQRGQALKRQTGRRQEADDRAAAAEQRSIESHALIQKSRGLDIKRKQGLGGFRMSSRP